MSSVSPGTLQTNPYALFDPSQWSNPYSQYNTSALPQASYVGMPTNFAGQQIQPPPGMTINQTPQQPAPAAAAAAGPNQQQQAWLNQMQANAMQSGSPYAISQYQTAAQLLNQPQQQQAAAATAPAATNSAGLTPQQYMALRANPGPVPTYGATVPQSASSAQPTSGQGGVLQQFLSNWKPASSGAGSGFQQGFSAALKNQGY